MNRILLPIRKPFAILLVTAAVTVLSLASAAAQAHGKKVLFWDHQWGSTTDDQIALWNLLSAYPGIIHIGEDYWPNELWVSGGTRLPTLMDYLPPGIRAQWEKSPFGILSINDAEDYGAGKMTTVGHRSKKCDLFAGH